jgi:hypothetical protein
MTKHKIVQSFITGFNEQARLVQAARDALSAYKSKWQLLNPNTTGTNLTSQQVSDMGSYLSQLTTVCNLPIVAAIEAKDIPSHDVKGLD